LLTVNILLSEPELEAILQKCCAKFGEVKFIRLLPVANDNLHRLAFVQMIAFGGSTLGSGAVALCLEANVEEIGARKYDRGN
jgi:hypothetical protein